MYADSFYMKAEDAYLAAIGSIYGLAAPPLGWEGVVPSQGSALSKEINGIRIGFQSLTQDGDRYRFQYKHVIVGIVETVNALARRSRFCFTHTNIFVYNNKVGEMAIGRRPPGTKAVNVTIVDIGPASNSTESPNPTRKGEIVDPEDSNFVISYELVRKSISCPTLLNAALNGMANSAVFGDLDQCREFGGFSSSGEVAYQFIGGPPGISGSALSYVLVRTVLELLPARLYEMKRCGEVEFDLIYEGDKLGGGSFFLF